MTFIRVNGQVRSVSLEQLIEDKQAQINKFNLLVSKYAVQNPIKAVAKQEEFEKKKARLQLELKELQEALVQRTEAQLATERASILEAEARERQRLADLEAAEKKGYEKAMAELMAQNKAKDKDTK